MRFIPHPFYFYLKTAVFGSDIAWRSSMLEIIFYLPQVMEVQTWVITGVHHMFIGDANTI